MTEKLTRFRGHRPKPKTQENRPVILYVEDDDSIWEVTHHALKSRFDIHRAANSREAFVELGKRRYDLILMDIQLSGSELNGIEITRVIKGLAEGPADAPRDGEYAKVPIIFVTAFTGRYSKEDLAAAGGDDVVPKPVDMTRLSLAIARLTVRGLS